MAPPRFQDHPIHFGAIRQAALAAADAQAAVLRHLHLRGKALIVGAHRVELLSTSRVFLIALGKAAPTMARAASEVLGQRLTSGVVTLLAGPELSAPVRHDLPLDPRLQRIPTGHPIPDEGSLAAGQATLSLLAGTRPEDIVVALVSGGGSAMLEVPLPGVVLEDLQTLNRALLRSGAPIGTLNEIRSALSRIKAGGLARLAAPGRCVGLILSDVVGNRLSSIASGPTVLRRADTVRARDELEQYGLWQEIPGSIRIAILDRMAHLSEEPEHAPRPVNCMVGSICEVMKVAAQHARRLGFPVRVLSRRMRGEAAQAGLRMARALRNAQPPACLLMGGETTVCVRGPGRGGRNQELALAAAIALDGTTNIALMTLATDGIDGPTDAAGAIISGETATRARSAWFDPAAALEANDTYPLLDAMDTLIHTGPTGTNVGDLVVGLTYR